MSQHFIRRVALIRFGGCCLLWATAISASAAPILIDDFSSGPLELPSSEEGVTVEQDDLSPSAVIGGSRHVSYRSILHDDLSPSLGIVPGLDFNVGIDSWHYLTLSYGNRNPLNLKQRPGQAIRLDFSRIEDITPDRLASLSTHFGIALYYFNASDITAFSIASIDLRDTFPGRVVIPFDEFTPRGGIPPADARIASVDLNMSRYAAVSFTLDRVIIVPEPSALCSLLVVAAAFVGFAKPARFGHADGIQPGFP